DAVLEGRNHRGDAEQRGHADRAGQRADLDLPRRRRVARRCRARPLEPRRDAPRAGEHPSGAQERRRARRGDRDAMRVAPPIRAPGPEATPEQQKEFFEKREAARAFEAIFVKKMLSSLEKTSKPGATGEAGGGGAGGIYASMMVSSLAESVSQN